VSKGLLKPRQKLESKVTMKK